MKRPTQWTIKVSAMVFPDDGDAQLISQSWMLSADEVQTLVHLRRQSSTHIDMKREALDLVVSPLIDTVKHAVELQG